MTPEELERWRTQQINAAIERGVNPLDAAKAMDAYLATLPPGADPATYVAPARTLEQVLPTHAIVDDARGAWYGDVEPRVARLLDAKDEE